MALNIGENINKKISNYSIWFSNSIIIGGVTGTVASGIDIFSYSQ